MIQLSGFNVILVILAFKRNGFVMGLVIALMDLMSMFRDVVVRLTKCSFCLAVKHTHWVFLVACPDGRFQCGSGECISDSSKCDGDRDCFDGSDESPPHCCKLLFFIFWEWK